MKKNWDPSGCTKSRQGNVPVKLLKMNGTKEFEPVPTHNNQEVDMNVPSNQLKKTDANHYHDILGSLL